MRATRCVGGLVEVCFWRGGVGRMGGRLEEAALGRGREGREEVEEEVGVLVLVGRWVVEGAAEEKGLVGGWEERERRRWVVEEGFSRMILALGRGGLVG